MTPILQQALEVAKLTLALGLVSRATLHEDGVTPESDTTHTTMLGILGVALANRFPEMGLDPGLIAQFALVHDFPEAICGDTNSLGITAEAKLAKACREAEAYVQLQDRLSGFFSIEVLMDNYHKQQLPEAKFVRVLDKVLPKLTHTLNEGAALPALGVSPESLRQKHDAQIQALCAEYPDMQPPLLALLREACEHAFASYRDGGALGTRPGSQSRGPPLVTVRFSPIIPGPHRFSIQWAEKGASVEPAQVREGFVVERNGSFYAGGGRGVSLMREAKVYVSEAAALDDDEAWIPVFPNTRVVPFQPETP